MIFLPYWSTYFNRMAEHGQHREITLFGHERDLKALVTGDQEVIRGLVFGVDQDEYPVIWGSDVDDDGTFSVVFADAVGTEVVGRSEIMCPFKVGDSLLLKDSLREKTHYGRLYITSMKCEGVQNITEDGAIDEGVRDGGCLNCGQREPCDCDNPQPDKRDTYANRWDSYHGEGSFSSNAWTWVFGLSKVKP